MSFGIYVVNPRTKVTHIPDWLIGGWCGSLAALGEGIYDLDWFVAPTSDLCWFCHHKLRGRRAQIEEVFRDFNLD